MDWRSWLLSITAFAATRTATADGCETSERQPAAAIQDAARRRGEGSVDSGRRRRGGVDEGGVLGVPEGDLLHALRAQLGQGALDQVGLHAGVDAGRIAAVRAVAIALHREQPRVTELLDE